MTRANIAFVLPDLSVAAFELLHFGAPMGVFVWLGSRCALPTGPVHRVVDVVVGVGVAAAVVGCAVASVVASLCKRLR